MSRSLIAIGVCLAAIAVWAAAGPSSAGDLTSFSGDRGSAPPAKCSKFAATDGSDLGAGTYRRPFRTPERLLKALRPGQTGCLRGGTYRQKASFILDVRKSNVTLTSYPREVAHLEGIVVIRRNARNVRLSNLRFEGTGVSNSIQVYGADFVLEDSDVTNGWRGRSCLILGDSSVGAAVRPVIRGNRFHECGTPSNGNQDHAIYASSVSDGVITGNVFWNSAAYAVQLYPNAQNTVFSHNVIDGGGSVRGGVVIGGESGVPSSGNTVEFNVITYAATYNIESWWGGSVGSGNVARNNCVYGGGQGNIGSNVGFASQGNQTINPLFVNRSARDYRLQSSSGCLEIINPTSASRRFAGRQR